MSILQQLSGLKKATADNMRVRMTPAQSKSMAAKLKLDNRMNVYPNIFDVKTPYRVQIKVGRQDWVCHGYFTNLDVAAAVGTIVSAAAFGDKALAGKYDAEIAEAHPEFQAWLVDERNQEVLAIVGLATAV